MAQVLGTEGFVGTDIQLDGTKLVIEIDLAETQGGTNSGKNARIASTLGRKPIMFQVDGLDFTVAELQVSLDRQWRDADERAEYL